MRLLLKDSQKFSRFKSQIVIKRNFRSSIICAIQPVNELISYHSLTHDHLGPIQLVNTAFQFIYESFHVYTGLPWWATIFTIPFLARVILLKSQAEGLKNTIKLGKIKPLLNEATNRQTERIKEGVDPEEAKKLYIQEVMDVYKSQGFSFGSLFKPLLAQMPLQLCLFFSLLQMCKSSQFHSQLSNGGILNFTDLTVSDPYFIIPTLCGLSFFALLQIQKRVNPNNQSAGQLLDKFAPYFAGFITLISINFPTAIGIYWIGCYLSNILAILLFQLTNFRIIFKLSPIEKVPIVDLSNQNPSLQVYSEPDNNEFKVVTNFDADKLNELVTHTTEESKEKEKEKITEQQINTEEKEEEIINKPQQQITKE